MKITSALNSDRGLSVAELAVVCVLVGVLVSAMYLVLNTTTTLTDRTQARTAATESSRIALDKISRELRQAQEIEEGDGVFAVSEPRRCSFYADIDRDLVPERVTYWIDNGVLYRVQASATSALPPYTFGPDSSPVAVISDLDPSWTGPAFVYLSEGSVPQELGSGQGAEVSAVEIALSNLGESGRARVTVSDEMFVKIRAVHNTIQ